MGQMKNRMEQDQHNRTVAMAILEEAGAVTECQDHLGCGYYLDNDDQDAVTGAYKIANRDFSTKADRVASFETRSELTDLIKNVYETDAMQECPGCVARDKHDKD